MAARWKFGEESRALTDFARTRPTASGTEIKRLKENVPGLFQGFHFKVDVAFKAHIYVLTVVFNEK
jgi:hypothetical protein